MTTYQDPPLHSRRAARQGERNAAYGQQPEQDAEPLTYATQNRPPVPQYEGPDFRARRTPEASTGEPVEAEAPVSPFAPAASAPEQQGASRPRDFSPEARQSAPAAEAPRLDAGQPIEHTMTRRELRALREAQGLTGMDAPAPVVPASAPAAPAPTPVESVAPAPEPAPVAEPSVPELSPFEALFAAPSTPQPVQGFAPDPIAAPPAALEPAAQEVVAEPIAPAPAPAAVEPIAPAPIAPAPIAPAPAPEPVVPAAPAGHWTTQADLDDATQASEATISRNVGAGSGVITTSALVLPSMPNPEFTQLGTGEVLITGSIDLPHSLATSGAHPQQLDEHHLDHELDPGDHQVVSTDSQPVRAVKAISSHTSTRNVIVAKKPAGNRGLTILIVSAAAMAAVVVTLLVVGLVTNVL
jgi:hypothetical protein